MPYHLIYADAESLFAQLGFAAQVGTAGGGIFEIHNSVIYCSHRQYHGSCERFLGTGRPPMNPGK